MNNLNSRLKRIEKAVDDTLKIEAESILPTVILFDPSKPEKIPKTVMSNELKDCVNKKIYFIPQFSEYPDHRKFSLG